MSFTLVVLAAGLGSRYGSLKQMAPVGAAGEWLLDYSVYDAWRNGANKLVFVIRPEMEDAMRERFDPLASRLQVEYVAQCLDDLPAGFSPPPERQKPWGTGHALRAARNSLDQPFVVINADDFYGPDAYERLARFFARLDEGTASADFAMVAFLLRNTLSEHGSVCRGICRVDAEGQLADIEEMEAIRKTPEGGGLAAVDGKETRLPGETPVSMNFWGFTPPVLDLIEEYFRQFLEAGGGDPRKEFYLPAALDRGIREKRCKVEVMETKGQWLGMTYRNDHPAVVKGIRDLCAKGVYPEALWGPDQL